MYSYYEEERLYTEQQAHEEWEKYVDERTLEMMMMDDAYRQSEDES